MNDKVILKSISYFFTNIAAELVLTVPQKHTVALAFCRTLEAPPSLLVQYLQRCQLQMYVGAGIATRFSSVKLPAGVDIVQQLWCALQSAWTSLCREPVLDLDVKKVFIKTDDSLAGAKISTLKLDPFWWAWASAGASARPNAAAMLRVCIPGWERASAWLYGPEKRKDEARSPALVLRKRATQVAS